MSKKRQDYLFWGIVLFAIGALFMLDNFGIDFDLWHFVGKYWPMILIAIGLKNIWYYFNQRIRKE